MNKNSPQTPTNQLQSCEIDLDDSLSTSTIDNNADNINDQNSTLSNKYHRSKSVDGRTRLKFVQSRMNQNNFATTDTDETNSLINDEQDRSVASSRFVPVSARREVPTARMPLTPPSIHQTVSSKLPPVRNSLTYLKSANEIRTQDFNGNHFNTYNQQQENDNSENMSYNVDTHQTKLVDNRTRTSIPFQHFTTNNNIQPSSSTSSVNSVASRTKPPVSIPISIDRKDSNSSSTDLNRFVLTIFFFKVSTQKQILLSTLLKQIHLSLILRKLFCSISFSRALKLAFEHKVQFFQRKTCV